jgi:hypothetical protein
VKSIKNITENTTLIISTPVYPIYAEDGLGSSALVLARIVEDKISLFTVRIFSSSRILFWISSTVILNIWSHFTNVYLFFKAKWNILIYCSWQSVQDWMIFHSLLKWFLYHGNKRKMNFLMFSGHIARRNIESGGSVVCCYLAFEVHPASWVQWSLHFIFIIRMTWYVLRLQLCT